MADNQIKTLKFLFLTFFDRMTLKNWEDDAKREKRNLTQSGGTSEILTSSGKAKARAAWIAYKDKSKSTVLGFASSVESLVGVIGQPGVDAFNAWMTTYAGGTGPLTTDAVNALQKWYNQYLGPLS